MKPLELTDKDFDSEVLQSSIPVLVDFWAVWCGPCKMIAPVVEEIASEYAGKLKVAKVDVDACQEVGLRFGIRSIPTLLLFREGKVVEQVIGAIPKKELMKRLLPHLPA
ncbi:MAG: thioredoxin [Bacteroidota bacterium]